MLAIYRSVSLDAQERDAHWIIHLKKTDYTHLLFDSMAKKRERKPKGLSLLLIMSGCLEFHIFTFQVCLLSSTLLISGASLRPLPTRLTLSNMLLCKASPSLSACPIPVHCASLLVLKIPAQLVQFSLHTSPISPTLLRLECSPTPTPFSKELVHSSHT